MYDEVVCYYSLPGITKIGLIFQTKTFDGLLDKYTIIETGRIIHHSCHWEVVPEEERPYYGKPEWEKNTIYQIMGSLKTVHDADIDINFHGYLNMYTHIRKKWFEYNIKFTDGNIVEIEKVKEIANV